MLGIMGKRFAKTNERDAAMVTDFVAHLKFRRGPWR